MPARYTTMIHVNKNVICAIYVIPSGHLPEWHQPLKLAIIPLDQDLKPCPDLAMFYIAMKPDNVANIDFAGCTLPEKEIAHVCSTGYSQEAGRNLFIKWYDSLDLPFNKYGSKQRQLMPLAYDWPKVYPYLLDWLGRRSYDVFFHPEYRDPRTVANLYADQSWFHSTKTPYQKDDLAWLCKNTSNQIQKGCKHDALYMADRVRAVYRTLLLRDYLNLP